MKSIFGNKSDRDLKKLMPIVNSIKAVYPEIEKLSNDELRAKTASIRASLAESVEPQRKEIAEIKAKCRWCIVVSHGGEEFAPMPNPYPRERYCKFLELGADVVVAHHPHVPENYELFDNGKAIFYSLGNFIFDTDYQRAHLYTDVGILLKLIFTEEKMDFEAMGIQIVRGEERIDAAPLPGIFENVPAEEYELLAPLGAKAFVREEQRKMLYLEPKRFTNAPDEVWNSYFFSTEPDGYFEGAHMDLSVVVPFSQKAEEGRWKQSRLEGVKAHILRLLED